MSYVLHYIEITYQNKFKENKKFFIKHLNDGNIMKLYLFKFSQQDIKKISHYLFLLKLNFNIVLKSKNDKFVLKTNKYQDNLFNCITSKEELLIFIDIMDKISKIIQPVKYRLVVINDKLLKESLYMYGAEIHSYLCS